ncbi:hypothetical protein HDU67_004042 [Dinochytrium kinnereticum]|nr:hypothetical protein HDU67_004042 [Dinochytrium kinnereticum]
MATDVVHPRMPHEETAFTLTREDVLHHLREMGYSGEDISDAFIEECISDFKVRGEGGQAPTGGLAGQGDAYAGIGHEVSYSGFEDGFEEEAFEEWDEDADAAGWDVFREIRGEEEAPAAAAEVKKFQSQSSSSRIILESQASLNLDEEVEDAIRYFNITQKSDSYYQTNEFYSDFVGQRRLYSRISQFDQTPFADVSRESRAGGFIEPKPTSSFSDLTKDDSDYEFVGTRRPIPNLHEVDSSIVDHEESVSNVIDRIATLDLTEVRKQIEKQKDKLRRAINGSERDHFGDMRGRQPSPSISLSSERQSHSPTPSIESWRRPLSARSGFIRPPPEPPKRKKHDPVSRFHEVKSVWERDTFVNRLDPKNGKITIRKSDVAIIPPRP